MSRARKALERAIRAHNIAESTGTPLRSAAIDRIISGHFEMISDSDVSLVEKAMNANKPGYDAMMETDRRDDNGERYDPLQVVREQLWIVHDRGHARHLMSRSQSILAQADEWGLGEVAKRRCAENIRRLSEIAGSGS